MNYYSRNSSVIRKSNPPPGFLLKNDPQPITHKSRLIIPSRLSFDSSQFKHLESHDMLVLDDDVLYVPSGDQILVEEVQDNPAEQDQSLQQSSVHKHHHIDVAVDVLGEQKFGEHREQVEERSSYHDQHGELVDSESEEQKTNFFRNRNYSFGDKIPLSHNSFSDQPEPLIRKLFNKSFHKDTEVLRKRTSIKQKQRKINELRVRSNTLGEEGWTKIVKNFIRKRTSSEGSAISKESIPSLQIKPHIKLQAHFQGKLKIQLVKSENGEKGEIHIEGSIDKNSQSSDQINSGYFGQVQENQENHQEEQRINFQQRIRTIRIEEQQQQSMQSPYKQKIEETRELKNGQNQQQETTKYITSTQLLRQAISELPDKLIPTYIKIQKQVQRRQYEAAVTIRKMQETQSMIQMLIQAHRNKLNVDDYILEDQQSPALETIKANREVIMGLIRRLAIFY